MWPMNVFSENTDMTKYEINVLMLITDIELFRYMVVHKSSVNFEIIYTTSLLRPFWERHLLKTSVYKSLEWSFSSGSLKFPWTTSSLLSSVSRIIFMSFFCKRNKDHTLWLRPYLSLLFSVHLLLYVRLI